MMAGTGLPPEVVVAMAESIVTTENTVRLVMNEEGIAYAQAIHELVHRYALAPDTTVAISAVPGGPQEALALLDQGFPIEYLMAMAVPHE